MPELVETKGEHYVGSHYAMRFNKLTKISGYKRRQHNHWTVCPHCGKKIE